MQLGFPLPKAMNPADYYMGLVNVDFLQDREEAEKRVGMFTTSWTASLECSVVDREIAAIVAEKRPLDKSHKLNDNGFFHPTFVLLERNFKTALKNVVAYWVRVAMYGK